MAYDQSLGTANVRAIAYDKTIKNLTEKMYKFKQALTEDSTNAYKNYFWREDPTVLTGSTHNTIRGLARGANFPQAVSAWEQILSVIEKFGLECVIDWEDIQTGDFDMQSRQLYKVAEGIAAAVDSQIWDVLTESRAATTSIQQSTVFAGWSQASAAIIDDLMAAKQLIAEANCPTDNLMLFINPRDHRYIVKFLGDKGAQWNSVSASTILNGSIGSIAGINLIQSNNVSSSYALLVVPKICGSWKSQTPLTTNTTEDPYKSVRVRGVEVGVTQVHQPKAIVLIKGTANTNT